jgi:branched-chain amino acid transport system ATP-binding protein
VPELLAVERLTSGYGPAVVIDDVTFAIDEGRALAVLGRNGTGKTTLINTIVGLTTRRAGVVRLGARDVTRFRPEERAAAGIGWVPQERGIFRTLSVEENLSAVARPGPWNAARVFALFPRLAERRRNYGATLSGGEQQMLAVGRALVLNPKVILLDEPLEGLAPMIVAELLAAISRVLREERTAAIVVEQHARMVLSITDHAIILDRGRIVRSAPSAELLADDSALDAHLGVASRRASRG